MKVNSEGDSSLKLCVVSYQELSCPPLVLTRSVIIDRDRWSWQLHVHGKPVDPLNIPSLADTPVRLNCSTTSMLLSRLADLKTCAGNPDSSFVSLCKAKKNMQFESHDKRVVAYLDTYACVFIDGQCYSSTVRCSDCFLLSTNDRCDVCAQFRNNLRAQLSRSLRSRRAFYSKNANYRYEITLCIITAVIVSLRFMKTPERISALRKARRTLRNRDRRLARMKMKLDAFTSKVGVQLEDETEKEIEAIVDNHTSEMETLPLSDFQRIFWDQQVIIFYQAEFLACRILYYVRYYYR